MSDDPITRQRLGLSDEDLAALGQDDPDEGGDTTTDAMAAADSAEPYEPPTDPPVLPGGRDGISVAQGFAESSIGEVDFDASPGDDFITEMVERALATDAATSALTLRVATVDSVVYLRGRGISLEDGDLAAEVAARVPGVVEVVDETTEEP